MFGQIKQARGFRQFLLRGVEKVANEWGLVCLAHNILKLAQGGPRPLPHSQPAELRHLGNGATNDGRKASTLTSNRMREFAASGSPTGLSGSNPISPGLSRQAPSRHLGVQYARRMGFEVVAIDRGDDRAELLKKLGAHHYIDSSVTDIAKALQALGGAQIVLATASGGKAVAAALGGLRRGGVVISLGATEEPIELSAFDLLFRQLGVDGALTGTPAAGDATLRFSTLCDVAAMIETMPLERAEEAYAKMMSGKARFRMVLTMT